VIDLSFFLRTEGTMAPPGEELSILSRLSILTEYP